MTTSPSAVREPSSDRHTPTGALYTDAARDHLWMHFTRHSVFQDPSEGGLGHTVPIITRGEGHRIWDDRGNEYLDGQSYTDCAQTTAAAADEEVRKLLNDSYDQAKKILAENRGLLDEVALYLLQKETITGDELMQYVDADKRLRGSKQETLPEAEA